jgi:DNA-binding MarR family transcriptional regulator
MVACVNVRYLQVLAELSGNPGQRITIAEVGRRLGLSWQQVYRYVRVLAALGYVARVGGYYVVTDRGRGVLDLASEEVARLRGFLRGVAGEVEKAWYTIAAHLMVRPSCVSLDVSLVKLVSSLLASLLEVGTVVDPRERDEMLERLWREELKEYATTVLQQLEICGALGSMAFGLAVLFNALASLFDLAILSLID